MIQKIFIVGIVFLLIGCDFEYSMVGDRQPIDSSLTGEWRSVDGKEIIRFESNSNGNIFSYSSNKNKFLFENVNLLKIHGQYFLQARWLGKEELDGNIDRSVVKKPWLIMHFAKKNDNVILRRLHSNFSNRDFNTPQEYRAAFLQMVDQDDFYSTPVAYRKVTSSESIENDFSRWSYSEDKDPFTDSITYSAYIKSSDGIDSVLLLECERNTRIEVWFRWPQPLEDLFPPGVLNADGVKIDLRFDNDKAFEALFIPAKNWKDVVSLDPKAVNAFQLGVGMAAITNPSFKRLVLTYANVLPEYIARSETLLAKAYGLGGQTMTAEFNLDGADKVLHRLKKSCIQY